MYKTRNNFGKLFKEHQETGMGAEIGVQNGYFTRTISEHWDHGIYLVDRWDRPEELKECAKVNVKKHIHFLVGDSVEMASHTKDEGLDWVYIDAGHSYPEVKADFEAWFPKVRKGGIVSGHDYGVNDCIGVKEFIDEYMKLNPKVKMNFTTDDFWNHLDYQSWWFIKE